MSDLDAEGRHLRLQDGILMVQDVEVVDWEVLWECPGVSFGDVGVRLGGLGDEFRYFLRSWEGPASQKGEMLN